MREGAGHIVRGVNMTEIYALNTVRGQHVKHLLHRELAPDGREVKKDLNGQFAPILLALLVLQSFCRLKAQLKSSDLAVDYLLIINVANRHLP